VAANKPVGSFRPLPEMAGHLLEPALMSPFWPGPAPGAVPGALLLAVSDCGVRGDHVAVERL